MINKTTPHYRVTSTFNVKGLLLLHRWITSELIEDNPPGQVKKTGKITNFLQKKIE